MGFTCVAAAAASAVASAAAATFGLASKLLAGESDAATGRAAKEHDENDDAGSDGDGSIPHPGSVRVHLTEKIREMASVYIQSRVSICTSSLTSLLVYF